MATVNPPDQQTRPTPENAPNSASRPVSAQVDNAELRSVVLTLLKTDLNELQQKLNSRLINELHREFCTWIQSQQKEINSQLKRVPQQSREKWLADRFSNDRRQPENQAPRFLTDFLFHFVQATMDRLQELKSDNQKFRTIVPKVKIDAEREQIILHYAQQLGASVRELNADRKAFSRWFDEEAVTDRYLKKVGHMELLLTFAFDRLSGIIVFIFKMSRRLHEEEFGRNDSRLGRRMLGIWQRLNIESRMQGVLVYEGDDRIHVAVLRCLRLAISQLPENAAGRALEQRTIHFVNRAAIENNSDVWIQCEALAILNSFSTRAALPTLNFRLTHPGAGDDIFVRRHVLKLIEQNLLRSPERYFELPAKEDPSAFVRQQLARVAFLSSHPDSRNQWTELALHDDARAVRAAALLAGVDYDLSSNDIRKYLNGLNRALRFEQDTYVVRVALHAVVRLLKKLTDPLPSGMSESDESAQTQMSESNQDQPTTDQPTTERPAAFRKLSAYVQAIIFEQTIPLILKLQLDHESIPVRRFAAQASERIWAQLDDQAAPLIRELKPQLALIPPGKSKRFPNRMFAGIDPEKLGRIFAVLAQDDFGFDLHPGRLGLRIRRGPDFGFRFWRFFFEFTNTATDKREGLRHTTGRISIAKTRAPSQILGELSETKVPGEPLTIAEDGSWRPFLPLPDDFVSILNMSWISPKTVRFYSSQGTTTVRGPANFRQCLKAGFELSFRFEKYAQYRNWNDDSYSASTYVKSLRNLGFEIGFEPHSYPGHESMLTADGARGNRTAGAGSKESVSSSNDTDHSKSQPPAAVTTETSAAVSIENDSPAETQPAREVDSSVARFFSLALFALPTLTGASLLASSFLASLASSVWSRVQRFAEYFGSPFENSLEELVVFALLFLLFVIGKHLYSNFTFRRARNRIPLSIGGWGTRGKSGTERLKAALIGVMGHGLVSKTTGCEAMFIQAYPFGEPLEIPLFRPYDKATIWEHRNLIALGAKMDPSVFLWECMALNPAYVNVLQRQWTQDDLATITNTYPDHEDIQGPAGHNVAATISGFVPLKSHLLTTEEHMRPYVTESCRLARTTFEGVGWLESGLITDDILARFPYQEHPDNIALVAAMAANLGTDFEYSLKAMADFLVPDLGVLKTHPLSNVRTRRIEFTNGMSANERFGCMGNWQRLGYDKQDPWQQPATWICGVVNNRADRVPRSKVFAGIIVDDVNADRFFLIGNNLSGLQNYIDEAWTERAETISLQNEGAPWDTGFALEELLQAAKDFRQPVNEEHIRAKLKSMLAGVRTVLEDVESLDIETCSGLCDDSAQLAEKLKGANVPADLAARVTGHLAELKTALKEYREMREVIEDAPETICEIVTQKFVQMLQKWYKRKIVIVQDYEATGEEVIHRIVEEIPPGFDARVMGLQNIKGTGLDFVYRFQAWDVCHEACEAALSRQPDTAERGVNILASMPEIGQLCQQRVAEIVQQCRTAVTMQRADLQTQLDVIEQKISGASVEVTESVEGKSDNAENRSRGHLNQWLIDSAEQFLDVNDSLRRRDKVDVIYKDLVACRISRQRAIVELRKLNKRQKGGWLTSHFDNRGG